MAKAKKTSDKSMKKVSGGFIPGYYESARNWRPWARPKQTPAPAPAPEVKAEPTASPQIVEASVEQPQNVAEKNK